MEIFQHFWFLCFTYILSGMQSVSGCITTQFLNNNKDLKLSCPIATFTSSGIWTVNGVQITSCQSGGFCSTVSTGNYTFTSNTAGIYIVMDPYSSDEAGKNWTCTHLLSICSILVESPSESLISQMSTSIATESSTSVNGVFEFSNKTKTMFTGSITPTNDKSALQTSYLNTGSTNVSAHIESTFFYSNTETTLFYMKTETTTLYANTETTQLITNIKTTTSYPNTNTSNVDVNTEIIDVRSYTSRLVSTAVNGISGSLDTPSQTMTETFALPGYSLPPFFETSNVVPQNFSVTSMSFYADTLSDSLFYKIHVSSGSLITTDSSKYSILSMVISPFMSTTFKDSISYSSKIEDPSFSSHQYLSEFSMTLSKVSKSNQLLSAIIDTNYNFLYTTNTLITSYMDFTRHSFVDLKESFQISTLHNVASASTSLPFLPQSTIHHLSLQTTKHYETMQIEYTLFVTTPLYESNTDSAASGIYAKETVTSGKSYMQTSVMHSKTQLASTNDIQDSKTDFKPYSQSNDKLFSSESSNDLSSSLLQFKTTINVSVHDSYMQSTHMSIVESQSGIQTMDLSLFKNPSSIQISTMLLDYKTTLLTTTININSKTLPSMIRPSSKQTSNSSLYNEIETSFKDSLFSLDTFSGSFTSNDKDMNSLSSSVYKSMSTMSTNIIQNGLSEKNKTIIFISTSSAVIVMIVVILLLIFAKAYKSKFNKKPPKVDDKTSWSNNSIPPKTAFPDYSFTGKNIHPLLNTSSLSLKMFHYEQHWDDIV